VSETANGTSFRKLYESVQNVDKVSSLNQMIEKLKTSKRMLPETVVLLIKGLQNGTVSEYISVILSLRDAETVQTAIDVISGLKTSTSMLPETVVLSIKGLKNGTETEYSEIYRTVPESCLRLSK